MPKSVSCPVVVVKSETGAAVNRADGLPLQGIRVIDFTHHAAGPMCTMLLGDYGAEIIKIEPPDGEAFRTSGTVRVKGEHVGFLALNRNKKSVVIDLKSPAGKQQIEALIRTADVVVDNFRPGTMKRLGLGYERLVELNPRIVSAAISAFGATGARSNKQGLDVVLQAMSGLMSITGEPDRDPLPAGAPVADILSGVVGALGIVMAVIARNRSGQPQQVELGMLDAMISLLSLRLQQVLAVKHDLPRMGSGHPQACPWDVFHAADGPFVVAATRDEYWRRLCNAVGIPEYATCEGYATIVDRVANRPKVNTLLNDLFRQKPRAHWLKALDDADVPNGPLNSLSEAMADETVRESGVMIEVSHPAGGTITTAGPPLRFNGSRGARNGPPGLGEHTTAVLAELSVSENPSKEHGI